MTTPRVPNLAIDDELKRKLLFTLGILVIYRIGAHIAAPGVNVTALADFIRNSAAAGFFGLYDALGGGLSRATVFALGIMPYISASIIFQLAGGIAPSIGKMQKDEEGKKRITQWTRYLTVFIALSQAYTFALFTESIPGAVPNPGFASRLIMVVTLTAGAIFVMWLGEQITERGIGNGMSLLITFSILERLWPGTLQLLQFVQTGVVDRVRRRGVPGDPGAGHRGGGGDDDRGAADPHPDPAEGDGAGPDPRRPEDLHPDPADHRRRDADHLRPDHHHRARARWRASPRTPCSRTWPGSSIRATGPTT